MGGSSRMIDKYWEITVAFKRSMPRLILYWLSYKLVFHTHVDTCN